MTGGEVAERSIAAVLKTVDRKVRGFESHPLRQQWLPPVRLWLRAFAAELRGTPCGNGETTDMPRWQAVMTV
jgi:hypothetical protein